jgi:hypothetical protein
MKKECLSERMIFIAIILLKVSDTEDQVEAILKDEQYQRVI